MFILVIKWIFLEIFMWLVRASYLKVWQRVSNNIHCDPVSILSVTTLSKDIIQQFFQKKMAAENFDKVTSWKLFKSNPTTTAAYACSFVLWRTETDKDTRRKLSGMNDALSWQKTTVFWLANCVRLIQVRLKLLATWAVARPGCYQSRVSHHAAMSSISNHTGGRPWFKTG